MELREYLRILIKRAWLIIPLTLAALATSLFFSYRQTPIYESVSTYVSKLDSQLLAAGGTDTLIYGMDTLSGGQRLFVTYCQVMTSQSVREQAYGLMSVDPVAVGLDDYDIFCSNLPETNVLLVRVQGPSKELVTRLNEAIGIVGTARANNLYASFPLENLDPVELNEDPVSPKTMRDGVLGGALGLVVGITLAFMIEYLRSPLERLEAMSIRNLQLGTYNERYFRQRFEEEINRAHAKLRPISLALLHLTPNEEFDLLPESVQTSLMRSAALTIQDSMHQKSDIIAYLKPRTFGILLSETPGSEAQEMLQGLHMQIRARTHDVDGYVATFVANTGVVVSSGNILGYQEMLEKASEALKIADSHGENTIHLIATTPRPFLTTQDDMEETTFPASTVNGSVFNASAEDLFNENELDNVDWQNILTESETTAQEQEVPAAETETAENDPTQGRSLLSKAMTEQQNRPESERKRVPKGRSILAKAMSDRQDTEEENR